MAFAKEVEQHDPRGLAGVIRILGRVIFADFVKWRIESTSWRVKEKTRPRWLLFPPATKVGPKGESFFSFCPTQETRRRVDLARCVVLPWPWNPERLAKSLARIGEGREWGRWTQDRKNHYVEYWEPIGIAFVTNGNHSITAGVLAGEGMLNARQNRDITPLFGHVHTDGIHYFARGEAIAKVNSVEFAAIYEIGRRLAHHGISASPNYKATDSLLKTLCDYLDTSEHHPPDGNEDED